MLLPEIALTTNSFPRNSSFKRDVGAQVGFQVPLAEAYGLRTWPISGVFTGAATP